MNFDQHNQFLRYTYDGMTRLLKEFAQQGNHFKTRSPHPNAWIVHAYVHMNECTTDYGCGNILVHVYCFGSTNTTLPDMFAIFSWIGVSLRHFGTLQLLSNDKSGRHLWFVKTYFEYPECSLDWMVLIKVHRIVFICKFVFKRFGSHVTAQKHKDCGSVQTVSKFYSSLRALQLQQTQRSNNKNNILNTLIGVKNEDMFHIF